MSKFRYVIARNKITRLVDVIDITTAKVVSAGHANHDAAEKVAAKLLSTVDVSAAKVKGE